MNSISSISENWIPLEFSSALKAIAGISLFLLNHTPSVPDVDLYKNLYKAKSLILGRRVYYNFQDEQSS